MPGVQQFIDDILQRLVHGYEEREPTDLSQDRLLHVHDLEEAEDVNLVPPPGVSPVHIYGGETPR